jgi:transcriptional regulator with XRE-family HTH domain
MAKVKATNRRGASPPAGHDISDQLREIIASRGLSGYAVGQLAGVNPGQVARFLGRQRGLTLETVDKIGRGLGLRLIEVAARRRPVRSATTAGPTAETDEGLITVQTPGTTQEPEPGRSAEGDHDGR